MPAEIGALLLAAGGSRRMGKPKQLLDYRGKSLIRHVADEICAFSHDMPVMAVLGAHREQVAAALARTQAHLHHHAGWEEGIGSSIRAGLRALLDLEPAIGGVIVIVCDQPFISGDLLAKLPGAAESENKTAAACLYAGTVGTPAYFGRPHFPALLSLTGDRGAKKLILALGAEVALIAFERGAMDIDTPEDYKNLPV